MASILVPVLYLFIVFGGLFIFSSYYRKRLASQAPDPYFPRHKDRDLYVTLLQRADPPTPDHILKAALVRRAMTDVQRIMRIREDKPALQNLLQKGSVGDDLWNSLLAAEKELEAEILEVAAEANSFAEGWGTFIFQTATEMIHNEKIRSTLEHIPALRAEKEREFHMKPGSSIIIKEIPSTPIRVPGLQVRPVTPTTPNSASSVPSSASTVASSTASSSVPSTPQKSQPSTSGKSANGLAPPPSASAGSVISSDAESINSPVPSRTPKSGKKSKRRK